MSHAIPLWWPLHPPIYDINKTYRENAEEGPFFFEKIPHRTLPPQSKWVDFLGHKVASTLGIPAGPLLNSKWTTLAGRLGFDIVTYKTIRNKSYDGYPLPNCRYVDFKKKLSPKKIPKQVLLTPNVPKDMRHLSITNSFGMPSRSHEYLQEDIPKAKANLKEGQVLVVSIVGSFDPDHSFVNDFVETALFAKDCGASIIEANFSCPNVTSEEGSLFTDPEAVFAFASSLTTALKETPLIIKLGNFTDLDLMKQIFIQAAKANVRAISGINTISMQVVDKDKNPALGHGRLVSGVCGDAIRLVGLDFVKSAHQINKDEKLDLCLIGMGGIMQNEHFDQFFDAGADIAMAATGMMWDPFLALRYHNK